MILFCVQDDTFQARVCGAGCGAGCGGCLRGLDIREGLILFCVQDDTFQARVCGAGCGAGCGGWLRGLDIREGLTLFCVQDDTFQARVCGAGCGAGCGGWLRGLDIREGLILFCVQDDTFQARGKRLPPHPRRMRPRAAREGRPPGEAHLPMSLSFSDDKRILNAKWYKGPRAGRVHDRIAASTSLAITTSFLICSMSSPGPEKRFSSRSRSMNRMVIGFPYMSLLKSKM